MFNKVQQHHDMFNKVQQQQDMFNKVRQQQDMFNKTLEPGVLKDVEINNDEVDEIVLVGGFRRILGELRCI